MIDSELEGTTTPEQAFEHLERLGKVVGPPVIVLPSIDVTCTTDSGCALTSLGIVDDAYRCCSSLLYSAGTVRWTRDLDRACRTYEPFRGSDAIQLPACRSRHRTGLRHRCLVQVGAVCCACTSSPTTAAPPAVSRDRDSQHVGAVGRDQPARVAERPRMSSGARPAAVAGRRRDRSRRDLGVGRGCGDGGGAAVVVRTASSPTTVPASMRRSAVLGRVATSAPERTTNMASPASPRPEEGRR